MGAQPNARLWARRVRDRMFLTRSSTAASFGPRLGSDRCPLATADRATVPGELHEEYGQEQQKEDEGRGHEGSTASVLGADVEIVAAGRRFAEHPSRDEREYRGRIRAGDLGERARGRARDGTGVLERADHDPISGRRRR